jgi:hypothetical protein
MHWEENVTQTSIFSLKYVIIEKSANKLFCFIFNYFSPIQNLTTLHREDIILTHRPFSLGSLVQCPDEIRHNSAGIPAVPFNEPHPAYSPEHATVIGSITFGLNVTMP